MLRITLKVSHMNGVTYTINLISKTHNYKREKSTYDALKIVNLDVIN